MIFPKMPEKKIHAYTGQKKIGQYSQIHGQEDVPEKQDEQNVEIHEGVFRLGKQRLAAVIKGRP